MTRLFETEYSATLNVDSFDAIEVQASPTGSWVHLILKSGEEFEAMHPTNDTTTRRIYHLLINYWLSEDLTNRIVTYKDLHDGKYDPNAAAVDPDTYAKKAPMTTTGPVITTTGTGSSSWPAVITMPSGNSGNWENEEYKAAITKIVSEKFSENKERR